MLVPLLRFSLSLRAVLGQSLADEHPACVPCAAPHWSQPRAALLFLSVAAHRSAAALSPPSAVTFTPETTPGLLQCRANRTPPSFGPEAQAPSLGAVSGQEAVTSSSHAAASGGRAGAHTGSQLPFDPALKIMLRAKSDMSDYGEYAVSCPDPSLRLNGGNEMPFWYLLLTIIQLRLKMLRLGV